MNNNTSKHIKMNVRLQKKKKKYFTEDEDTYNITFIIEIQYKLLGIPVV